MNVRESIRVVFTANATDTFLVGYDRFASGTGSPSFALSVTCEPLCGNGQLDMGEDCDDGNRTTDDGCSSTCHIEPGYGCTRSPSVCTRATCGNGILEVGEACDDGGTSPTDGCDALCRAEMFTATPASGKSTMLHGTIGSSTPTFSRPASCDQLRNANSQFHYQAFVIENMTTVAQTLTITAAWMDDGFLIVYAPPFLSKMPLAECLDYDDDFRLNGSRVTGVYVQPGQQLIVVATTYDAEATIGYFTLTIDAG